MQTSVLLAQAQWWGYSFHQSMEAHGHRCLPLTIASNAITFIHPSWIFLCSIKGAVLQAGGIATSIYIQAASPRSAGRTAAGARIRESVCLVAQVRSERVRCLGSSAWLRASYRFKMVEECTSPSASGETHGHQNQGSHRDMRYLYCFHSQVANLDNLACVCRCSAFAA